MGGILKAFEGTPVERYCTDAGAFLGDTRHPVFKRALRDCGYTSLS
jgi:hypothetical protein